jgi:predicted aspartyl protease
MTFDHLSRRRFGGSFLASLPFMTNLLRAEPPRLAAESDRSGHLSIAVAVNGRGPFRFVVDTGADRSVLADTTAAALGLRPLGEVMLAGIVRTVRADMVPVASLAFGDQIHRDLALPVLPRALLQADGYLGLDALDGNRVVLDFAARELTIIEPTPTLLTVYRNPDVTVLPAQGGSGHLRASRCSVDHISVAAFVDTGAESSMGNEALYRELLAADPAITSRSTVLLTGLTGGTALGKLIRPREVQLGRLSVSNCPLAIADLQVFEIWGLADRPALVLGMNWLRKFKRVSIDYGRKELRFEIGRSTFPLTARAG